MFSTPRTGISPFSQELGSLGNGVERSQNDHAPLGTNSIGFSFLGCSFCLLHLCPQFLSPKDFSYGHSSVPWPDICFSIPKCEHFSLFTLLVFLLEIPLVAAYFLLLA